jgi:hypothetical protein
MTASAPEDRGRDVRHRRAWAPAGDHRSQHLRRHHHRLAEPSRQSVRVSDAGHALERHFYSGRRAHHQCVSDRHDLVDALTACGSSIRHHQPCL